MRGESNQTMDNEELNEAFKRMTKGLDQEVKFIDKEDTFSFKCIRCGKCCMGFRNDIILNPYDIYKMAKGLGISCNDVIKDYCHIHIGHISGLPVLTIDHDKKNGWCKFLKFDIKDGGKFGCSINSFKPGACANHPIGVVRNYTDPTDPLRYIITEMCPNHLEEEVKVADWVANYEKEASDIDAGSRLGVYTNTILDAKKMFEGLEIMEVSKLTKDRVVMMYIAMIVSNLYGGYDTSIPFIDQIEKVKADLLPDIEDLKEVFSQAGIDLSPQKIFEGVEKNGEQ